MRVRRSNMFHLLWFGHNVALELGNIRGCSAWQWLTVFAVAYGWMSHNTTRDCGRDETAI